MERKNNSLIVQGSILALAGILTKIIGFIYRIPMANMLGEQGNGIYSVAFGIYNVALTLSSYSLPMAVSKLMSSRLAEKQYKNAFLLIKRAFLFALIAGLCSFSVLFFASDWLEALYSRTGLAYPLKVLAPTTFIVALLGVFRGYFQGHSNMLPTALSQILEQIVNAIVSIVATYLFMKSFAESPDVSAIGASGATMGTLAGAFGALVMMSLFFVTQLSRIRQSVNEDGCAIESKQKTYADIITTMLPIILSQTIYQIGFTVDDLIFGNVMAVKGVDDVSVSSMQGVFNTQYTQLVNLPVAIATALAASALPSIVNLFVQGKHEEKNKKTTAVIKLTMTIAIPSAVGLAVLARPIITILFPNLVTWRETAIMLLQYGSSACVFYSLSTITTSILQGNNRMKTPVLNSLIAFIIHVIIIYPLLKFTDLSIYALLIGDITFPLTISLFNLIALKKKAGFSAKAKCTFILPLFASLIMGVVAWGVNGLLLYIGANSIIALGVSLVMAVALYGVLVLLLQIFTDDELPELPMGTKILKLSKKIQRDK